MSKFLNKKPNIFAFLFTIIIITSITLAITITNIFVIIVFALAIKNILSFFVVLFLITISSKLYKNFEKKFEGNKKVQFNVLTRISFTFILYIIYSIFGQVAFLLIGLSFALLILFFFYTWERSVIKLVLKHNKKENEHFMQKQMIVYILSINIIIGLFLFFGNVEKYIINLIIINPNNINFIYIFSFISLLIFEFFSKKGFYNFNKQSTKS